MTTADMGSDVEPSVSSVQLEDVNLRKDVTMLYTGQPMKYLAWVFDKAL